MTRKPNRTAAHLLALVTIIIWGNTFIASKHLLSVYSPVQIIVLRLALAYVILLLLRPRFLRLPWRQELAMVALGLFGNTVYFLLENTALLYTLASNVSIIVATAPILTALLAHFFLPGERLHRNVLFGFLIAFTGVAMVVFNGTVVLKLNPLGDLLSFGAALCWAVYSVLVKRYLTQYDNILLTRRVMFWGIVTALPVVFATDTLPALSPLLADPMLFLCVLFLGMLGSAVCYVAWNVAFDTLGVVTTNNYIYVNPFVTLVSAALFLREPLSWMGICGAVLITAGVILSGRKTASAHEAAAKAQ